MEMCQNLETFIEKLIYGINPLASDWASSVVKGLLHFDTSCLVLMDLLVIQPDAG